MPLDVGIVGLPGAGKTTLFTALTGVSPTAYGQEHVGVAPIPDERLEPIAEVEGSAKMTPATVRLVDVPGLSAAVLGNLRQADALLAVLAASVRTRILPTTSRRSGSSCSSPTATTSRSASSGCERGEVRRPAVPQEVADLERVLAHVDDGRSLSEWERELPPELEPLTTKPVVPVVNGAGGIDLKLEARAGGALARRGGSVPRWARAASRRSCSAAVRDGRPAHVLHGRRQGGARLDAPAGPTALDAAATIHTDIARGFIRCEVIAWQDLVESGESRRGARRGLQRLEGKDYVVEDGDVLNIRFNV